MSICLHLQLGFILNLAKSSLVPSQEMAHLGVSIDTLTGLIIPTLNKVQEISHVAQYLLNVDHVPAQDLQPVVCLMVACQFATAQPPCVCFSSDRFHLTC